MPSTETVKVIVRKRPLNSSEQAKQCQVIAHMDVATHQCTIVQPKTGVDKTFAFDSVYDSDCSQRQIYDETGFPLVESVLKGYNGTIFAYGQTGCGKTFTMLGDSSDPELYGIIPNSFQHIFGTIGESEHEKCFLVRCSYSEIYNEEIRDLLQYDPHLKLELKESKDGGIYVSNLSTHVVKNIGDIEKAMNLGNAHRVTKGTKMNERSSRSHAIFTIYIETSEEVDGEQVFHAGKLNLVDLAGSERQKKTGAVGERLKEATKINLSLSALGNVISALVDGHSTHIPYRDSKLTRLLQDSLGGNTKTVMIAVISPADYNYDESLSTLRYASRAKFIKNKPIVNEDPKDALLRQYAEEIKRLKELLETPNGGPNVIEKVIEKERIVEKEKIVEVPVYIDRPLAEPQAVNQPIFQNGVDQPIFQKGVDKPIFPKTGSQIDQAKGEVSYPRPEVSNKAIEEIKDFVIIGGETQDALLQEKLKEQRALNKKLKKQKKRERKLLEEKAHRDKELLEKEANFQDLQSENEGLRTMVQELRAKYKAAMNEISDINHENENDKENLLESVRALEFECGFLLKVIDYLLPKGELKKIRKRSKFDEFNNDWRVPPFVLQQKAVAFPKLQNRAHLTDLIQNELKSRNVVFQPMPEDPEEDPLRQARFDGFSQGIEVTRCENDNFIGEGEPIPEEEARPLSHERKGRAAKNFSAQPLAPIDYSSLSGAAHSAIAHEFTPQIKQKQRSRSKKRPLLDPIPVRK